MEKKTLRHVQWQYDGMRGLAYVRFEETRLEIGTLAGRDMPVDLLLPVLNATLPGTWIEQAEAEHQDRMYPWTISRRRGYSGCCDYRLYYLKDEELLNQPKGSDVHVSMYGKLNEGITLWLGDLPPILAVILEDYPPAPAGSYFLHTYEPELRTGYQNPGASSGLQEALESLRAMEVIGND